MGPQRAVGDALPQLRFHVCDRDYDAVQQSRQRRLCHAGELLVRSSTVFILFVKPSKRRKNCPYNSGWLCIIRNVSKA